MVGVFSGLTFIFLFFLGLAVGSFLNCLIYRLETGQGFLKGRSFCPNCKQILAWKDLIPLFSFLILKGKCRYCHQKISWHYPLVELATGLLFLFLFHFQLSIINYFLTPFLIVIFVYDLKHYLIPDKIIYPAIAITFLYRLFETLEFRIANFEWRILNFKALINPLFSAVLSSLFFLAIILFSRGKWMGFGDFKLAILLGLFLGWPKILMALFLAFLIGAIIGIGLVISGKKTLKSEVPFGPFLVTGAFISLFWGEKLIQWYLHFFS